MHILISNDDGIFANGIRALVDAALEAGHRVSVFAPDSQRSAAGHSLSLRKPLQVKAVEFGGVPAWSVSGTPADCVRLGLFLTREDPVDCVLAGVNNGQNRGAAILYSGTVSAAMEASLCNVPGVAVSRCEFFDDGFEQAARLGVKTLEWAMEHPLPRGEVYNLNVPYGVQVKGIRPATLSYEFIFPPIYNQTPEGWVLDYQDERLPETLPDSDLLVTGEGYASLSIVSWNMLANTPMPDLAGLNEE